MSNLLYIYERNSPTVSITRNTMEKNENFVGKSVVFKKITEVTPADIDTCDILQMIRPTDPYSAFLAKRARESGCFVMSAFDDGYITASQSQRNMQLYQFSKTAFPISRGYLVYLMTQSSLCKLSLSHV